MAPLSRDLAGIILPHDHYGSHLDKAGTTIDEEKELQNFEYAGEVLAQIWSDTVIDGRPVVTEFVQHEDESDIIEKSGACCRL